jgi:hypothetical protein
MKREAASAKVGHEILGVVSLVSTQFSYGYPEENGPSAGLSPAPLHYWLGLTHWSPQGLCGSP